MKTALTVLIQILFISSIFADVETRYNGKYVEIYWDNPKNVQIDYFVIEKSKNGKKFKEHQTVPVTNRDNSYSNFYEIDYTNPGKKTFYRVKHVDVKGSSYYTNVSQVGKKTNENQKLKASINKYKSKRINHYHEDNVLVVLLNEKQIKFTTKLNLTTKNEQLVATDKELPQGNYLIIGASDNLIYGQQLLVNKGQSNFAYIQNTK